MSSFKLSTKAVEADKAIDVAENEILKDKDLSTLSTKELTLYGIKIMSAWQALDEIKGAIDKAYEDLDKEKVRIGKAQQPDINSLIKQLVVENEDTGRVDVLTIKETKTEKINHEALMQFFGVQLDARCTNDLVKDHYSECLSVPYLRGKKEGIKKLISAGIAPEGLLFSQTNEQITMESTYNVDPDNN